MSVHLFTYDAYGQNTENTLEHNRNQTKPDEFIEVQLNKAKLNMK